MFIRGIALRWGHFVPKPSPSPEVRARARARGARLRALVTMLPMSIWVLLFVSVEENGVEQERSEIHRFQASGGDEFGAVFLSEDDVRQCTDTLMNGSLMTGCADTVQSAVLNLGEAELAFRRDFGSSWPASFFSVRDAIDYGGMHSWSCPGLNTHMARKVLEVLRGGVTHDVSAVLEIGSFTQGHKRVL